MKDFGKLALVLNNANGMALPHSNLIFNIALCYVFWLKPVVDVTGGTYKEEKLAKPNLTPSRRRKDFLYIISY